MPAGSYDLQIDQYEDYHLSVTWTDQNNAPIDLTGFSGQLMIRQSPADATVLLALSTSNGGITLGTTNGLIRVTATAVQTGALPAGTYVYDLVMTDSLSVATRLLQGYAYNNAGVTHS